MIEIDQIGNVLYDWCDMVLNGATVTIKDKTGADYDLVGTEILPTALNVPLLPSDRNSAGRTDLHIVIGYTPETDSTNGIDPINVGIVTNYDPLDPTAPGTYSHSLDVTDGYVVMELREVNGKGKLLKILEKLQDHWMVKMYFDSFSMSLAGKEGAIVSVPFETEESTHIESVASFKFAFMDGIEYNLGFIGDISGTYEINDAEGTKVAEGTYDTENQTGE